MDFKQATKISIALIAGIGVIGLIVLLFVTGSFGFGEGVEATDDFGRLNISRLFLLAWETFWLSSIAMFFIYVAKRAVTSKTEEEIERLETFEPKLFKIVIGLLIVAALLTLLVPSLFDTNAIPQFNQNEDGIEVHVMAYTFQFVIDDQTCQLSTEPAASCAEFETGQKYIFLLESADTTHGFTIYDGDYVLLMQAQIVPGYVTRVAFTFDHAGDYSIRCAEYCGSQHHQMVAAFTVVEGA